MEQKIVGQIYLVINIKSNKLYVGQTIKRIDDSKYLGSGLIIKRAIKRYGKSNFKKIILENINTSRKELDKAEIFWISYLKTTNDKIGYNICKGGKTPSIVGGTYEELYGLEKSLQIKSLMSEQRKGKKNGNYKIGFYKNWIRKYGLIKANKLKKEFYKNRNISGANNGRAKKIIFTDPNGDEHLIIGTKEKFIKENNLSISCTKGVLNEKRKSKYFSEGWTVKYA